MDQPRAWWAWCFLLAWLVGASVAAAENAPHTVVALKLQKPTLQLPALYQPYLSHDCLWQGETQLHGRKWLLGVLEQPGSKGIDLSQNIWLYLLQSAENAEGRSQNPPWIFSAQRQWFVDGHAYRVDCYFEGTGRTGQLKLAFHEEQPRLAELKLKGNDLRLLQLYGKYLVLVENPATVIQVPADRYSLAQVTIGKSNSTARFAANISQSLQTSVTNQCVFSAGGPLTNQLTATMQGRSLRLDYRLTGADGQTYLAVDRTQPPRFKVYADDRIVHSGTFEYG